MEGTRATEVRRRKVRSRMESDRQNRSEYPSASLESENKKNNKIEPFRILQEFQGLKFFPGDKSLHHFYAQFFVNRKMRVEPSAMPMRHNKEPSTAPKA